MIRVILTFITLLALLTLGLAQNTPVSVTYISAENIYIDAGREDGLKIGEKLDVFRDNLKIAQLEIVYVSESSAACHILNKTETVVTGDQVHVPERKITKDENKTKIVTRQRTFTPKPKTKYKKNNTRISGNLSGQWYHIKDLSPLGNNLDQPGFRVNLKMKNLFNGNYNFYLKTRSRYYSRTRPISSTLPQTEWRNRIYTVSFGYDNEDALFNYKIGRIISNAFSGVGYLDGVMLQQNMTRNMHVGVFAGTQPQWQYSRVQTSLQKYGGFLTFNAGDYGTQRFESTIAGVGEYHSSIVSREFLYMQNNYSNPKFNFYQSAEIDVNRDWRLEKTGSDLSLTSLYLNSNYKITSSINAGLSYDNRKNYYTYEIISIADSLFDDAMRYGLRGNVNFRLPSRVNLFTNFGLRKRKTDVQNTYSYSGGLNKYGWTSQNLSVSLFFSGFSNYYSDGYHVSARFGKSFKNGHYVNVSYGTYFYMLNAIDETRTNHWVRFNGTLNLFRHFYFMEHYEYVWGTDSPGHRFFTELGYRF